MAKKSQRSIAGAYQLLLHVPKRAVVDALLNDSIDNASLATAFKTIVGKGVTPDRGQLINLTVLDLARIFEAITTTTEADARELHDAWRYRGMKSLYLYRYLGDEIGTGDDLLTFLNDSLDEVLDSFAATVADGNRYDLQFDAWDTFRIDRDTCLELRYRHVASIAYVDPDDEEAKAVRDLRNGFAWIVPARRWVAIAARDLDIRDLVADTIRVVSKSQLVSLRFTKELVRQIEQQTSVRRVAAIDPRTQTTRRYSGRHLGLDTAAQNEMQTRRLQCPS